MYNILFVKTHPDAKKPVKAHGEEDAGFDLYAIEDVDVGIEPVAVKVGLKIALPQNCFAEIHTRSSYGLKGARCHLGIIDSGYRGPIDVIMTSPVHWINIKKGDKIAQLIIREKVHCDFIEMDKLPLSKRGEGGFGSTGK